VGEVLRRNAFPSISFPPLQRAHEDAPAALSTRGLMAAELGSMLVATVPTIEGRPVQWYLGVVSGEALMDTGGVGDGMDMREARDRAIQGMIAEAAERGANAVLGVGLDCETIEKGERGVVLMVTASGTAVRV